MPTPLGNPDPTCPNDTARAPFASVFVVLAWASRVGTLGLHMVQLPETNDAGARFRALFDASPGDAVKPSVDHNAGVWIARWAVSQPKALAWVDDHRRCDYAQAEDRVRRLTAWLKQAGVGVGDRVALWVGNRGATLEAVFATARLGAIVLPINARLTPDEVAFQLEDATPTVMLVERPWRDRAEQSVRLMNASPPRILGVGMMEEHGVLASADRSAQESSAAEGTFRSSTDPYEQALASVDPCDEICAVRLEDPMILMYTSGTTGNPKGALLPHRKAFANSLNAEIFFDIESSDRVLVVAPLFHSLGLQILALPAIFKGAGLIIQEGFLAERVWGTIESEGVTYYGGVPTMHQRMLDALIRGEPVDSPPNKLRFAFTAGAAAPPALIRAFHDRGLMMKQGYGQTETSILTCLNSDRSLAKAGSVGHPVHHVELRLVQSASIEGAVDQWEDAAVGEVGEIVARGPITMLGYWRRPKETAETLREGWVRTGDLATRDEDFDLTLVGRSREMYISGGENVYPAEVEAVFLRHPDVAEAAVVAITDLDWGEVGRAHVVVEEGGNIESADLLSWLSERLARFKIPREVVFEDELPRTASGKVQKHLLRPPSPRNTAQKDAI